jgi:hypothetical protein
MRRSAPSIDDRALENVCGGGGGDPYGFADPAAGSQPSEGSTTTPVEAPKSQWDAFGFPIGGDAKN